MVKKVAEDRLDHFNLLFVRHLIHERLGQIRSGRFIFRKKYLRVLGLDKTEDDNLKLPTTLMLYTIFAARSKEIYCMMFEDNVVNSLITSTVLMHDVEFDPNFGYYKRHVFLRKYMIAPHGLRLRRCCFGRRFEFHQVLTHFGNAVGQVGIGFLQSLYVFLRCQQSSGCR